MTEEEIEKLARDLADELYNDDKTYNSILWWCEEPKERKAEELVHTLHFLLRSHYIVPKERIKEYYDDVCEDIAAYKGEGLYGLLAADPTMCERAKGQKQMLHRLFGSQLGKEAEG